MASGKEQDEEWADIEHADDNNGEGSSRSPSPTSTAAGEHDGAEDPTDPLLGTVGYLPAFPSSSAPLSAQALAAFNAAQERAGVVYISRIPPGMQPPKIRHLMSAYGEVGRVFLQQEDPKRAYLRRKHTTTKKAHYTEGWVEFTDKRVARTVAEMLNAQPIGGKKGSRWRDDVWTMKYLPRFKWSMLTEQIAHERAIHKDRLRQEISQSRMEQTDYLKQVELARVLDKRAERKRKREEEDGDGAAGEATTKAALPARPKVEKRKTDAGSTDRGEVRPSKRTKVKERQPKADERADRRGEQLQTVLGSIF